MQRGLVAAELIERDDEIAGLREAVLRAVAGDGALVLVRGAAGIGKSALLDHALTSAREAGMQALAARGGELEDDVTYGVVRQLLERRVLAGDARERRELLAGQAALASLTLGLAEDPARPAPGGDVDHGIFWLVCNLAAAQPMALVIDDAHWADRESLRFALYLARRLEGLPVLLLVAARSDEPTGPQRRTLELLADEPGAQLLVPSPLSEPGCARLLSARLGRGVPGRIAHACHEATGGTPFYLTEIADSLADDVLGPDAVTRVRSLAPPAVSRSVLLRLGRHREDVQAVAAALAVLGDEATAHVVAATARIPIADAAAALEQLTRAGIAAAAAPALAHPIIRAAIYTDLPMPRRAALHAAAAAALAAVGAAPEQVAHHLVAAEPAADARTVALLRAVAARDVGQDAPQAAVRLLKRAWREPPLPAEHAGVLVELGEAELAAGEAGAAAASLRAALALKPNAELRVRAGLGAARALAISEGFPAAIAMLTESGAGLTERQRLALEVEHAALSLYLTDRAAEAQRRVRALAALDGETPLERLALAVAALAWAFDRGARSDDAVAIAVRALGGERLIAEQGSDAPPFGNACYVLLFAERYGELQRQMDLAFTDARTRGSAFGFLTASLGSQMIGLLRGELIEAVGHGEAFLGRAVAVDDTPATRRWVSSAARFQVEALIERGDGHGARNLLEPLVCTGDLDSAERGLLRYARALVAELDGDVARARADFEAYGEICRIAAYEDRTTPWRLGAARAMAAMGDTREAVAVADDAVTIATRWGTPGGLGIAQRTRALVGDVAQRCDLLDRAVATLERSEHRTALAGALVDHGFALRSRGHRTEARGRLERGMELAARCEAQPTVQRARSELHALGARPRRLMFSGVESLTASERRVATMAAQGLTNRDIAQALFVTQKTVETHLGNVYRKLDIASRVQLPGRLAAAGA